MNKGAEKIASQIKEQETCDDDLNRQLCELAGLAEEYDQADGDTFEII